MKEKNTDLKSRAPKWHSVSLLFKKDGTQTLLTLMLVSRTGEESIKDALATYEAVDLVYAGHTLFMKSFIACDLEVSAEFLKEFYRDKKEI